MLSNALTPPRQPQHTSLRQEYQDFVDQCIEEYKEQLTRSELLSLGDEAIRELDLASTEQLVLTEVTVRDHVDWLIKKRLNLPTFRKWRNKHLKVRKAQQNPGYWGVDSKGPVADLAARWDESDTALALGEGTVPTTLLLAAFQWRVVFIDPSIVTVTTLERRAASEGLASRFQTLVVHLDHWIPDVTPSLVVVDPRALHDLDAPARVRVIDAFKRMTRSGGFHCILPIHGTNETLAPAIIRAHYNDWSTRHPYNESSGWFLALKP